MKADSVTSTQWKKYVEALALGLSACSIPATAEEVKQRDIGAIGS